MLEADLPEIIESEDPNPGWQIRIGGSKQAARILLEPSKKGDWFDTEGEMNEFVRSKLALNSSSEDGSESQKL